MIGIEVRIIGGEEDFGPGYPGGGLAPGYVVEATASPRFRVLVAQAVERAPVTRRTIWARLPYPLDAPDLRRARPQSVRYDAIFGIHMGERDRLAALREQVDQRRAAECQRLRADGAFQFRQGAVLPKKSAS